MKKIILSLVLAATAFNGWLASAGSSSLSASELQVDGVEMMAEGEIKVIDPVSATIIGGLIVTGISAGCHYIATCGGHWIPSFRVCTYPDGTQGLEMIRKDCVECSWFSDDGCTPPQFITYI